MKDPAIEVIREVRHKISEEYGHDIKAFLDPYRELESQCKERLAKDRGAPLTLPRRKRSRPGERIA